MIRFCEVCNKYTKFYDAFGHDDKAVCCVVCKAPQEREEVNKKMESVKLNEVERNSITLKKDAKGNYAWEIKLYFNDDETGTIERANNINSQLKHKFD
jgi:hypothetical protein